jgi:Domain of unknown function (DUF4330)
MKIVDSKGRLLGKISILDLGAAIVILLVVVGIFFFPGTTGSVAQNQIAPATKPVEVEVIVRGLSVISPRGFLEKLQQSGKTNVIIRNQPAGSVNIKSVTPLPRKLVVPQPDGSVKALDDPRQEEFYSVNFRMILGGQAQLTPDGIVLGGSKIKIGSAVELEGKDYNFNASTIDVRVLE